MSERIRLEQVAPHKTWPSGDSRTALMIDKEPEDITKNHGIEFEEGLDSLDYYSLAAIKLSCERQAWLWKYRRAPKVDPIKAPNGGTEVKVDMNENLRLAGEEVLGLLGLTEDNVTWTNSEAKKRI